VQDSVVAVDEEALDDEDGRLALDHVDSSGEVLEYVWNLTAGT
jgi:hypothetical protein